VDAQTFETEEIVRVPAPCRPSPRTRSRSPSPVSSHLRPLRRYSSDDVVMMSSEREPYSYSPDAENDDERLEGVIVIPPLDNLSDEAHVRRAIRRHGFRTRAAPRSAYTSYLRRAREDREYEPEGWTDILEHAAEMEVDELESDCISSRGSSPVPVPAPSAATVPGSTQTSHGLGYSGFSSLRPSIQRQSSFGPSRAWRHSLSLSHSHTHTLASIPGSSSAILSPRSPPRMSREYSRHGYPNLYSYESRRDYRSSSAVNVTADVEPETCESRLDLAGICFDPSGRYVYTASTQGVSEWAIRGGEKKWWNDEAWR
jgi:hypothetical protein